MVRHPGVDGHKEWLVFYPGDYAVICSPWLLHEWEMIEDGDGGGGDPLFSSALICFSCPG
jgi:hypothetical protein